MVHFIIHLGHNKIYHILFTIQKIGIRIAIFYSLESNKQFTLHATCNHLCTGKNRGGNEYDGNKEDCGDQE